MFIHCVGAWDRILHILKQYKKNGISSVSDLYSEDYLNYLKDYKNWLKPEEINNPLFMNYEVEMPFEIEQEKAKNYISMVKP